MVEGSTRSPFPQSVAGKIKLARELKDEGNEKFKLGDLRGASQCYKQVFAFVNGLSTTDEYQQYRSKVDTPLTTSDEDIEIKNLKIAAHSNLSLLYLKFQKPNLALKHSNETLKLDAKHTKANFRKAQALTELKDFDKAIEILKSLKDNNVDDRVIEREIASIKTKRRQYHETEKRAFSTMLKS